MPTDLRWVQIGNETINGGAAGTPATPTVRLRGTPEYHDLSSYERREEEIGYQMANEDTYQEYTLANLRIPDNIISYEQLPYYLASSIRGKVKGVQDGSGSGYIYEYPILQTAEDMRAIATTISFTAATKKISDSGNGLAFAKAGDTIKVSGSSLNDDIYTVATGNVAGEIVVNESLSDESAGSNITVKIISGVFTLRAGNDEQAYQGSHGFVESWALSGGLSPEDRALMLEADWMMKSWTQASFADLDAQAVEPILFTRAKLYIDDESGTMGATEKALSLAGFQLQFDSGIRGIQAGGGTSSYSFVDYSDEPILICNFILKQTADITTEIANWQSNTSRLIEIKIEGATLSTAGTLYSKKTLRIQLPGKWMSMPEQVSFEGQERILGTFQAGYNPTAGVGASVIVVNELAALT